MADSITNVPQISTTPEPISQMPQLQAPKVDVSQFKNLDDLIFNILDGVGNKMSALAIAVAGKAMDTAANVSDRVMSVAQSPMRSDFVMPSSSPEISKGAEIEGPGRGKSLALDSAPSMGSEQMAQSRSPVVAQVSNAELGNLSAPTVGVSQQDRSQGISI